jgi:hypothetical protein
MATRLPPGAASPADLNRLATFVGDLERLLVLLLERPLLLAPYARELRANWEPSRSRLERVRDALASREADLERLTEHGLTGDELALKLLLFDDAVATLSTRLRRLDARMPAAVHPAPHLSLEATAEARETVPRHRRFGRKSLKRAATEALAVGDVIFESIGSAVPHVAVPAAGAGEFKQLVERVVGFVRRRRRRAPGPETDVPRRAPTL